MTEPLIQGLKDCIVNLTAQGFLQSFAAPGLLQTVLVRTEIGRSAHPLIQKDAVLMVADHSPQLATIQKLAAGHAATQDGAGRRSC